MFTIYHFIWLAICAVIIALAIRYLDRTKPSLETVLGYACWVAAASELIKVLTHTQMVPNAAGTSMHVFMEWRHMPLHLCSIQILLIFYTRFTESKRNRDVILAFMYPTCLIGAALALLLPSIFSRDVQPAQTFLTPIAYQFFLYHSMLVILGIYIARCGEVELSIRRLKSTLGIMAGLAVFSIYANSALSYAVYEGHELVSVETTPNFFFTFKTPIGIALNTKWQWLLYLCIIVVLAIGLISLFYLPYIREELKQRKKA